MGALLYLVSCSGQNSGAGTTTNPSGGTGGVPVVNTNTVGTGTKPTQSDTDFALTDVDSLIVAPGDTVTFSGSGLNTQLKMQSPAGISVVGDSTLELVSATAAKYTIPGSTPSGLLTLTASQGDASQKLTLLTTISTNKVYPLMTGAADTICSDTKFRDINGTVQSGSRNCNEVASGNLCVSDGQINCIANSMYTAAATSNLAAKIVSGNSVAGVAGTVTPAPANCAADGSTNCIATTAFAAAAISGLSSKVLSGTSVAGVVGNVTLPAAANVRVTNGSFGVSGISVTPTLADCSQDGGTGCVAVSGFPVANVSTFGPANIQSGYKIAGVGGSGTFNSVVCSTDGEQNCTVSGVFKAANPSGISTWDLRAGQTVAGISGALKTNCRNTVNSAFFNYDGPVSGLPNGGVTTGTMLDYWDTVDDIQGWSTSKVTAWSVATYCDSTTFMDVTTTNGGTSFTMCGTGRTCIYKDQISNLQVTGRLDATGNLTDYTNGGAFTQYGAVQVCNSSTYGGYSAGTWRLPTQKELMSLYEHGVVSLQSSNFISANDMKYRYWSSSSVSSDATGAWFLDLSGGTTATIGKI